MAERELTSSALILKARGGIYHFCLHFIGWIAGKGIMEVATEWIWGEQESSPPKPPSNIFSFFSESSEAKGPLLIYFVMLVEQNIYEYRKCVCMHIRACISMCVYPHTWMHVNVTATFYLFIFKLLLLLFLLYNIVLVFPYINMHLPWVYTCCPSWTPLPPASPYHPSGSSQFIFYL